MHYQFKYAGPKPVCSQHGIEFDHAKEDRFIYLETLVQLIEAFDKCPVEGATLHFGIEKHAMSEEALYEKLRHYIADLDERIKKEVDEAAQIMQHEIEHVQKIPSLSKQEKDVWIRNIKQMHDYVMQRAINKAAYHAAIETLAQELLKDHIEYLVIPMEGNYQHLAKSLSYALDHLRSPVTSDYKVIITATGLALEFDIRNQAG
jgi:LPS O-antigen subunit length determinant protein (WzzB/FepE family)